MAVHCDALLHVQLLGHSTSQHFSLPNSWKYTGLADTWLLCWCYLLVGCGTCKTQVKVPEGGILGRRPEPHQKQLHKKVAVQGKSLPIGSMQPMFS